MSTLGGIDHISNDSPVTVLVLDHGYNTHSPPVILVSDWRQLASQPTLATVTPADVEL
jgi:hypothetical protein